MLFLFPTPRFMLTLYWSNGARVTVIIVIFVYSALVVCFIEQPEPEAISTMLWKSICPFQISSFFFYFLFCILSHLHLSDPQSNNFFTLFLESCVHFSLPHLGLILGRSVKSIKQNLSTTFHKMKEPKRS